MGAPVAILQVVSVTVRVRVQSAECRVQSAECRVWFLEDEAFLVPMAAVMDSRGTLRNERSISDDLRRTHDGSYAPL